MNRNGAPLAAGGKPDLGTRVGAGPVGSHSSHKWLFRKWK